MSLQMAERTEALLESNPGLGDYLQRLNDANVDWAISGSAAVYLLTGARHPSDIDVTITDASADAAVAASPRDAQLHNGPEIFRCGDKLRLDFPARGLSFAVGELAVDVMDTGQARNGSHIYWLGLSDLALKHRLEISLSQRSGLTAIYVANPFDVIAMKAVLQRGPDMDKFDFLDVEAVLQTGMVDSVYAVARSQEIGLTGREWSFLGRAGLQTSIYNARA